MPYIPPNSNQIQPIAIPINKTHQLVLDNIPSSSSSSSSSSNSTSHIEQVYTPKAMNEQSEPIKIPSKESSVDSLTSNLTSTSLYSNSSTPPLDREDSSNRSQHVNSPATSSVISLPEQGDDNDQGVKTSRSDSSLRRRVSEVMENENAVEDEGKKVAGEEITNINTIINSTKVHEDVKNAFTLYREGLYAYTHSLWIQAKLSSSRAERTRRSTQSQAQFGRKESGMEKIAAKKALAKRLNG